VNDKREAIAIAKMIAGAEGISGSGRLAALKDCAAAMPGQAPSEMKWHAEVLASLTNATCHEYESLTTAFGGPLADDFDNRQLDVPLLSWRARNLLELLIWSTWCTTSEDNARRFYEDAHRDHLDILTAFRGYGIYAKMPDDWMQPNLQAIKEALQEAANYHTRERRF
jgi:hypothetical protein